MRTVSQVVKRVLAMDQLAKESMERGLLNLSAYAKQVKPKIDELLWKDVTIGSIVVSLSRMQGEIQKRAQKDPLTIHDISLQTHIVERIFKNEADAQKMLHKLSANRESQGFGGFFVLMQGLRETTLLCRASDLPKLSVNPIKSFDNLSAITVRLNDSAIDEPHVFYRLMKPLIAQNINIIEIITGLGEVTFVVRGEDAKLTLESLETR